MQWSPPAPDPSNWVLAVYRQRYKILVLMGTETPHKDG